MEFNTSYNIAMIELILGELELSGRIRPVRGVHAAVATAKVQYSEQLIDSFVLGNPHEDIFRAIYGGAPVENAKALGVLETFASPSIIVAADAAAKAAEVQLIEVRIARGMSGKAYMLITGTVASVTAAIEHAKQKITDEGTFLDSTVIPNPDPSIWESIL